MTRPSGESRRRSRMATERTALQRAVGDELVDASPAAVAAEAPARFRLRVWEVEVEGLTSDAAAAVLRRLACACHPMDGASLAECPVHGGRGGGR